MSKLTLKEQVNVLIARAYAEKNGITEEEEDEDFDLKVEQIQEKMKWTVIDGAVYDITNYIAMHPGGVKKINLGVGKDSTVVFHKFHLGIRLERTPLPGLKFGQLYDKGNK